MNYFDLVNKCLVELNYKQVNSFNELTKNDHKKIKNILRLLNTEICNYENWDFRLRKTELKLPANTNTIPNEDVKFCIKCGSKLPSDALFCSRCGAKL